MAPAPALPTGWDPGRDLWVLVGRDQVERARELVARGESRVVLVLPEGDEEGAQAPLSAEIGVARGAGGVLAALLALPGVEPHHITVRGGDDPWAGPERRREVAAAVADALRARRLQQATVERHGPTWLAQGLANLAAVARHPSVDALRGAFAGHPCVLISPGPSLSRNLDELPALSGRALLVAGTHTLSALERAGVAPDLAVAADPGELGRHFEGVDLGAIEALAVGATCRPECFELPVRRRFAFAANDAIDDWIFTGLGEDARLASGGSVACTQLSLALLLGCDPIALVGQDLSFPEGRFYAAETLDGEAEVAAEPDGRFVLRKPPGARGPGAPMADGGLQFSREQRLARVARSGGGTVPTSASFAAFLTWFEACAAELAGRVRLLNCTEGGALIRGMEHVPLAEAVRAWTAPLPPVGAVLERAARGVDLAARRERMASALRERLSALEPCRRLAERCALVARAAERDPSRLDGLARHEAELGRALRPLRFVSLLAQSEIVAAQEDARRARDLRANLAAARRLFDVVLRATRTLAEPMERALHELSG